jgi:hypothetical protein
VKKLKAFFSRLGGMIVCGFRGHKEPWTHWAVRDGKVLIHKYHCKRCRHTEHFRV